jgi:hypothetical protein
VGAAKEAMVWVCLGLGGAAFECVSG